MLTFHEASKNRQKAIANNEQTYLGRDCTLMHGGIRNTKTRRCCECKKQYEKIQYYRVNK